MGYNNNPINTIIPECNNPEKPNCKRLGERMHILLEEDMTEKEYYMCNKCYESWMIG